MSGVWPGISSIPVVVDLIYVVLDLLIHRRLLVRQPLKLAPDDAHLVLQQPSPIDDVSCA